MTTTTETDRLAADIRLLESVAADHVPYRPGITDAFILADHGMDHVRMAEKMAHDLAGKPMADDVARYAAAIRQAVTELATAAINTAT